MTEFTLASQIRMPDAPVDDDLLALGKQLETIACELKTVRMWVDEVSDLFHAEVERRATWPYAESEWNRWDAQAYWQTVCRIEKETEIGAAFVRAHNAEDVYGRVDPLCTNIKSFEASTSKGRLLKRWASAIQLGAWPDDPAAIQREKSYRSCVTR
jgi:hypothetical protein